MSHEGLAHALTLLPEVWYSKSKTGFLHPRCHVVRVALAEPRFPLGEGICACRSGPRRAPALSRSFNS